MALLNQKKFEFISKGLPEDTFAVTDFTGEEGLSECYEFTINLITEKADLDLDRVLQNPAVLIIHHENGRMRFHGIIPHIDQLQRFDRYTFYRAVLTPKLHWLNLTCHNQVFLNQSIPEILESVLEDAGLTSLDFEMRLPTGASKHYRPWEFFCQYEESHFHFFTYWAERVGLYYFFEQGSDREKAIVTDSKFAHVDAPGSEILQYEPPSGLDLKPEERMIPFFTCRRQLLPKKVLMKDYDYEHPSLDLTAEAEVTPGGLGHVYLYGDYAHFYTPEEGRRLARIRAEEMLCRERVFSGKSINPLIRPGYRFHLEGHYQEDFNRLYLTTRVVHRGNQFGYLTAGLKQALSQREQEPFYDNDFEAIPADVQYRPRLETDPPRIRGTITAVVDAAGSGQYAELDDRGRYKVVLPFDLSGRRGLKASAWLRMAQPYSGSDHGMNFPLHRGAEVLLSFMGGDPNQPVIIGTVPNGANPSVVNASNATMSGFRTAGGNQLHMEDENGHQRLIMKTGDQGKSYFRMGAGSDSEMWLGSDSINSTADFASTEFAGLNKTVGSMVSASTLTGFVKFQVLKKLISSVVKKLPDLGYKIGKEVTSGVEEKKKDDLKAKEDIANQKAEDAAKVRADEEAKAKKADDEMKAATMEAAGAKTEAERKAALEKAKKAEKNRKEAEKKSAKAAETKKAAEAEAKACADQQEKVDDDYTLGKGIAGLTSKVVMPFVNLVLQVTLLKFTSWALKKKMKSGVKPQNLAGLKKTYSGNYAFSVVHHDGATAVSQQGAYKPFRYLAKAAGALLDWPGASDPESIFLGTNKGSLLFAAKDDVDMCADNNVNAYADNEIDIKAKGDITIDTKGEYTVNAGQNGFYIANDVLTTIGVDENTMRSKFKANMCVGKIGQEKSQVNLDSKKAEIVVGTKNVEGSYLNITKAGALLKTKGKGCTVQAGDYKFGVTSTGNVISNDIQAFQVKGSQNAIILRKTQGVTLKSGPSNNVKVTSSGVTIRGSNNIKIG